MEAWARLDAAQRDKVFQAFLKAALLRAWLWRRLQ